MASPMKSENDFGEDDSMSFDVESSFQNEEIYQPRVF